LSVFAQNTNIGGTINRYSKVTSVIRCGNRMIVDSPSLFTAGMQVLIIQMQGPTADQGNTTAYGNVLNYNSAGNYEIQTIDSVIGDTIKFKYQLQRSYDASQSVQLIPLPVYNTATVTANLTCKPWNGSTGGVLLLKADSLVLNDSIKLSGLGFRGFYNNDSSQNCFGNLTDYYYSDSMHGAPKGEGIWNGPYIYGRGKNTSGGGGGDNENTGGGGGSNYGKGGAGGTIVARTIFCSGNGPGDGGQALAYSDTLNKVFMGGGGGCGHGNNSEGTGGVNGGGICIIIANTLIGNNKAILANGLDQSIIAGSDGAGGGGAGGSVLLSVGQYVGNITVSAKGGAGGKLNNDFLTRSCMGPAGGGGGGVLWVSQPAVPPNITYSAPGGINGINLGTGSTFCPYGVSNGALPGDTGGSVTGLVIPIPTTPYVRLSAVVPDDTLLCNDQQVILTASGISSDSVHYTWSTGQQTPSISFLATQSGQYTISVTDDNTCSAVKQVNLTVDVVTPDFSSDTSVCSPSNILLHANNTGTAVVSYAWSTGATTPTVTLFADSTRTYTVTVSSIHGCRDTAAITISVGNLNATYSDDTLICAGNSVTLGVYPIGGATYAYSWGGGQTTPTISVSPTADTIYTVTVSAGGGCSNVHHYHISVENVSPAFTPDTAVCGGGTVTLHADNTTATPVTYAWSTGEATPAISPTITSTQAYAVTVTSAHGCSATDSIHVTVGTLNVSFSDDTAVCPGNSAILSTTLVSGTGVVYTWSTGEATPYITVSPRNDTTYSIIVTDNGGCRFTHTYVVSKDYLGTIISGDTTTCPGGTADLSVTVPNVSNITYLWSDNETTQQITVTNTASSAYTVTVSAPNGCTGIGTVNVIIDSVRVSTRDTTVCPGSAALIYVSAIGVGPSTYLWSTGQAGSPVRVTPAASQAYRVTATDSLGCRADSSAFVTDDNNATHLSIAITSTPDSAYAPGDTIQLSVTGAALAGFLWTPGGTEVSDSTIQDPIATPQKAIQYCVQATDSSHCTASLCREIQVGVPAAEVAIPTAFTPNGDGINDVYKVVAIDGTIVASMKIYNRWGELVYEDENNAGWTGAVKNIAQPSETYTCFVTYYQKIYPDKLFYKMGSFMLIR
jgi:gliding motility-associated-like protein